METTATYDKAKDEFIIHSPTPLASKYWITNGALHAHYCVVFAQLNIDGQGYGVHTFLVPIRNEKLEVIDSQSIPFILGLCRLTLPVLSAILANARSRD